MKRWRWPFEGLYWRLTISYFLVALVAVLTVEAAIAVVPLIQDLQSYNAANPLIPVDQRVKQEAAPQLARYLETNPPNRDALNGIVLSAVSPLSLPLGDLTFAEIVDSSGQVLATAADANTPTTGLLATSQSQSVLHAALAGNQLSADLRSTLPDGQSVFASQITSNRQSSLPASQLLGAFFAVCSAQCIPNEKELSFLLASALEQSPPNRDMLNGWLWVLTHGASNSITQGAALRETVPGDALLAEVLSSDGQIVASANAPDDLSQNLLDNPVVQAAARAALAGSARTQDILVPRGVRETLVATPIMAYDGHLIGAFITVFIRTTAHSGLEFVIQDFWQRLQPLGFLFLGLATAVGTLTGVLVARSLRRRLRSITAAADAWSRGDLEVEVRDRSGDEIGQLARHLNAMADQLHTLLAARQELAVVEERNRLARDLHDSVKQHVFATALLVRSARKQLESSPQIAATHLAEAETLAGQTQEELTTLIRALRPAALADKGLVPVLRDYASDWSRRTGIAVELRIEGERATELDTEEALFRFAQEALTNVARHSLATAAELRLVWEGESLHLTVHDNGDGFDVTARSSKGLGLASMQERVAALGGNVTVESSPQGTTISALVPVAERRTTDTRETAEAANG